MWVARIQLPLLSADLSASQSPDEQTRSTATHIDRHVTTNGPMGLESHMTSYNNTSFSLCIQTFMFPWGRACLPIISHSSFISFFCPHLFSVVLWISVTFCYFVVLLVADQQMVEDYVRDYIQSIRTFSNYTFESALSSSRTEQERVAIVNKFYQRFADEVAKSPGDHSLDTVFTIMHIAKM